MSHPLHLTRHLRFVCRGISLRGPLRRARVSRQQRRRRGIFVEPHPHWIPQLRRSGIFRMMSLLTDGGCKVRDIVLECGSPLPPSSASAVATRNKAPEEWFYYPQVRASVSGPKARAHTSLGQRPRLLVQ